MSDAHSFTAWGKPTTKGRPRMTRRGRVFTPAATLEAEAIIREQYDGPSFDGPLVLYVDYFADRQVITIGQTQHDNRSKLRGDVDNYLKLTLDSLNGVAWADDKQIKRIHGRVW